MDASWWQLPGPGRFVAAAVSDLRSGRNVLLRFPLHAAHGVRDAVEGHVRANDLWYWRAVDAAALPADSPAALAIALHDALGLTPADGLLPGPAALAGAVHAGAVVWVDGLDAARWPVWARFLAQYQHACHAREEDRRGLFCVPLVGGLPAEPVADTALAVCRWGQSLGRLDVMLHLDRLLPAAFPSPTLRQVALAVSVELGGADPRLGARLAALGPDLLTDPVGVLAAHAAERGWTAADLKRPAWHGGVVERLEGEERVNSAALVAGGDREGIERRVWQGQVRVLYPFIEEQRVRLVQEVGRLIPLPVETTYGTVERAIDLEIGQLVHFLRGRRVPDQTWRQLVVLCDMRHSLAHLRPVPGRDLMSPEFVGLDRRG